MDKFLSIINRAIDLGYDVDMTKSVGATVSECSDYIMENVEYDYITLCETSPKYDVITWFTGLMEETVNGQFLSMDASKRKYFRSTDNGFVPVEWYNATTDDYVLMDYGIDDFGKKAAIIAKNNL